ncbi:uncharacterized protein Z520_02865 [Fonsecaea multimorphosa CBS 102226]|uniref:Ribosome biogenesis protein NOP53 n=1 Tax=Fonsecaea multimorphosa CBS 102226 TaxID=1442371 RepID=A0A0D2K660_9EURO|nr:uncharacterized protein Z520_02865 [Fonsecaea multimorphosa CBS 102226]KIY01313.1 hypothetical protein Z520_02865 [Fonsecaea multimorphosa CBS 102226]OAL28590.1 hypothetical protein AYO22_02784 [Fonsecaea multimorphosa]
MPPTSTSTEAPSQPSQPSRKGKKAWRKNVDISTVTSGLEVLREEIIQHGKPLAEKHQNELFTLDTTGSKEEVLLQATRAGKPHKGKILKMDEILGRRSAVPALENLKSNKRTLGAAVTDGVLEPSSKRQKKDWVSKKEIARLRNNLDKTSHLDVEDIDNATSSFDLWADNGSSDAVQVSSAAGTATTSATTSRENEYVPKHRAKVAPSSIRRPPVALTATGLPTQAVPQPDAGQSYNPSFEDWDSLLTREGEKEVEAEQRRLREAQIAAERQARIDELANQPDPRPEDNQESEWEGFETEDETTSIDLLKRKRPERKTPAQRNKIKRRKEAERLAKHEARMAERQRRGEEIFQSLLKKQDQHSDEVANIDGPERSDLSSSAPAPPATVLRRKPTLGPSRATIPPQPLELVLPDELQDSLRRLRPEGNLLSERFRNILVNGKLEARRPLSYAASRKKRVKVTEKWWSKDFSLRV